MGITWGKWADGLTSLKEFPGERKPVRREGGRREGKRSEPARQEVGGLNMQDISLKGGNDVGSQPPRQRRPAIAHAPEEQGDDAGIQLGKVAIGHRRWRQGDGMEGWLDGVGCRRAQADRGLFHEST